jgi:hypothetical protein
MMAHQLLPGSLSVEGTTVTAGVHTGSSEWDIQNLRYVRFDWEKHDRVSKLIDLLGYTYDNSEGCLAKRTFKMKEGA